MKKIGKLVLCVSKRRALTNLIMTMEEIVIS